MNNLNREEKNWGEGETEHQNRNLNFKHQFSKILSEGLGEGGEKGSKGGSINFFFKNIRKLQAK